MGSLFPKVYLSIGKGEFSVGEQLTDLPSESSNFIDEPKIYILREMAESPAFRSLSRVGLLMLMDFLGKRRMVATGRKATKGRRSTGRQYVCENNGRIQFPYSEAVDKEYSRKQFRNGIDELQEKGFIDITHLGSGGRKPIDGNGDAHMYLVDDRWRDFDEVTQQAVAPPKNTRKKDTRMDRGFQKYWHDVRVLAISYFQVERANPLKKEIRARLVASKSAVVCVSKRLATKQRQGKKIEA